MDKNQLNIERVDTSANYQYCKMTYGGNAFDNVVLRNTNICIVPFETDTAGKIIQSVYLYKYFDFLKSKHKMTTLLYKNNEDKDDSNLDTVLRCINDTMRIPITDSDIKRVFYLGEIELNSLISGNIPCYGVNVTGMVKETPINYIINDELEISLEKFPYSTILQSTSHDFLIASSVFMLLSYLS